ncbi:DUF427 domain-containing protein [Pseudoduganella sp. FT25W]|uniref:DUF427 domain-containing protein n=1 Tax=Duganella alba TaxID=2666081 RepID=A0A6L5QBL6_9BURK|nr:DUF427 domain-containing protein [Duganella alba]MRX07164.1 DUF427 domain-containing protein [Duganella alba]MRX15141.1 DUF427 domain-containing protein [Duganella alba]
MQEKIIKLPSPAHPIDVKPVHGEVVVRLNSHVLAKTTSALVLQEAALTPVFYIPRQDVDQAILRPSAHVTYCPYKGDCSYYDIEVGGHHVSNAVWFYLHPYVAVAAIQGHVAFYPERVDSIQLDTASSSTR